MHNKKVVKYLVFVVLTISLILFLFFNCPTELDNSDQINPYDENGNYFHEYDFNNLKLVGDKFYYEDDKYTSMLGIDVSAYQKNVDYEALKNNEIEFVYIRAGYRGNTSGDLFTDEQMDNHYQAAKKAGLKIGFYFFSQAISDAEAIEEANYFLDITKDYDVDLPFVLDAEFSGNRLARTSLLLPIQRVAINKTFLNELSKQKVDFMLYTNLDYIKKNYKQKELAQYKLWYAQYSREPSFLYPFEIWQYTASGEIDGYDGYLDLDLMFIPKDSQKSAQ